MKNKMCTSCAPFGLTQRGAAPLDSPPSPVAGMQGCRGKTPLHPLHQRVLRLHHCQGFASPTSSPGPSATLRAAACGVALDNGSGWQRARQFQRVWEPCL